MQKITPFLWFDSQAEEAVGFYTSIFPNSKVTSITRYGDNAPRPKGTVMTIGFQLHGGEFIALNGGPYFRFNEAVSFVVNCDTQSEIDRYWEKLVEGGKEVECGWLKDRFGLSWQIVPAILPTLLSDPDPSRSQRVMDALLEMKKIDIPTLEKVYENR